MTQKLHCDLCDEVIEREVHYRLYVMAEKVGKVAPGRTLAQMERHICEKCFGKIQGSPEAEDKKLNQAAKKLLQLMANRKRRFA